MSSLCVLSYYAKHKFNRLIVDWRDKKTQLERHGISYYRLQMSDLNAFKFASYKT